MSDRERSERKRYPRLRAPVYFNTLRLPLFGRKRRRIGDPLGGMCVYTDEEPKEGVPLELEVFLPDGTSVVCRVEVAWLETLPDGGPARCDVGLRLTAIHPHDRERLSTVLEHA